MVHAHNPNILEVGAGGCIQSHLQLYSKSEVSLCRPSLCVITIITTWQAGRSGVQGQPQLRS